MVKTLISKVIAKVLGSNVHLYGLHHVSGGLINQAYKAVTSQGTFFIKVHQSEGFPKMFEKEKTGLQLLSEAKSIDILNPIGICNLDQYAFFILEWLESAPLVADYWSILGEGIAQIHKKSNRFFGFMEDNYFGALPQSNNRNSNWGQFFVKSRLMPLVKMAAETGYIDETKLKLFDKYYILAADVFPDEEPALLHGDLWKGNIIVNANGRPTLIDPAIYYGHREMDIAMTFFVGEFEPAFYEAYQGVYPLKPEWEIRRDFAMMYYNLAHLNLFGISYLPLVEDNLFKWVGR